MSDQEPNAFPQRAEAVVAALTELFRHQGNRPACEVLENAKARIEETGYDNWNGGTDLFTLFLDLPLKVFAPIEPEIDRLERSIGGKLSSVARNTGNKSLSQVTICPILDEPGAATTKVAPTDVEHLWEPGMFRLFLSHVSTHKVAVAKLKWEFRAYGVSCFVAHEDIEPTKEWQHEIELALRSMNALVALLTPDFHASKWTDQEIGYALGRGVLVIPVRLGLDPYGFIGVSRSAREPGQPCQARLEHGGHAPEKQGHCDRYAGRARGGPGEVTHVPSVEGGGLKIGDDDISHHGPSKTDRGGVRLERPGLRVLRGAGANKENRRAV